MPQIRSWCGGAEPPEWAGRRASHRRATSAQCGDSLPGRSINIACSPGPTPCPRRTPRRCSRCDPRPGLLSQRTETAFRSDKRERRRCRRVCRPPQTAPPEWVLRGPHPNRTRTAANASRTNPAIATGHRFPSRPPAMRRAAMIARIKGRWGNTQILLLHDGWGPNGHSPRALGGASCPVTKPSGSRASSAVHCRPDEAANPNVTAVAGIPKITWPLRAFLSASCLESERGRAFRSLRSGRARSTKRDLRTTARWKGCRVTVPVGGAPSTGLARAFVKRLRDSPSVAIGDAAVGIEASPRRDRSRRRMDRHRGALRGRDRQRHRQHPRTLWIVLSVLLGAAFIGAVAGIVFRDSEAS